MDFLRFNSDLPSIRNSVSYPPLDVAAYYGEPEAVGASVYQPPDYMAGFPARFFLRIYMS
jgi:hypothetical protein